ncbi:condensin complex protein MksE [Pedobacter terrae]|uniref:condensin complex protein MksE n=1 Tax=Pedobacter terrae TaxID=405671 RepID=UPI002FF88920
MENEINDIASFGFLWDDQVQKYFADINIMLLSGKHIDEKYYMAFSLLEDRSEQWTLFYKSLYNLNLVADKFDGKSYFYLDFFDTGKGKFTDHSRHRELTETQTLIGLMLLDIYYKRFFDDRKIIQWVELRNIIMEGEQQDAYKRILFNEVRTSNTYDAREWGNVHRKINAAIDLFDKIGWLEKQSSSSEEVPDFEIKPAINRLAKMYEYELLNFETFVLALKKEDPQ